MTPTPDARETVEEWVARNLAEAPPLTAAQREIIRNALRVREQK